ncbi:aminoacyl-tRNA hydrolase [Candidatus Saccharibacteria bacterium]|nr:aminoacyl-tRNA hydrolase [Candidatus Saccharibacteria bacterium]
MGLFTKKLNNTASHTPLYTLGNHKTWLLVGLGNPGEEYQNTRHNIGFNTLDKFVESADGINHWVNKKDLKSLVTTFMMEDNKIFCIKPTTFMNESGQAVQAVKSFYKYTNAQIIIIHDELDIDFGTIKTGTGGGAAGHNGIKSVISHIGSDFNRIRIGINSPHRVKNEEKDFVLKDFSKEEQTHFGELQKEITSILTESIFQKKVNTDTRKFIF